MSGGNLSASSLEDLISGSAQKIKFRDRIGAGNILATILEEDTLAKFRKEDMIVFGIPRGGVVLADVIASRLSVQFGFILVRKLTAASNEELALGAIMEDGTSYLNEQLIRKLRVLPSYLENEKNVQKKELLRRKALYLKRATKFKVKNRVVVLVDDGVATGATIIATARWVRKFNPKSIIIATPVAPRSVVRLLRKEADMVEVIAIPSSANFKTVGQFYQNFHPTTDETVIKILNRWKLL